MTDDNAFNEKNSFNSECQVPRLLGVSSSSSSSSSYPVKSWHLALRKYLHRRNEPNSVVLNFTRIVDIAKVLYDKKTNIMKIEKMYSIGYAHIPQSSINFTVYDKDSVVVYGKQEIVARAMNKTMLEKTPPYDFDKWKNDIEGDFVERIDIFDSKKIMKDLKRLKLSFKDLINFVIDDTGIKDKRIIDMTKASILPIPMSQRERLQPFNCNSFVLTNTGVGKSSSYVRLLGFEPSTDFSEAGLFGGFSTIAKGEKRIIQGSLNDSGVQVFDEFPERNHPIMNKLLTYTETGEVTRDMVEKIICKGTKSLVFLGNASMKLSDENFIHNVIGLSTGNTLSRVGRRFPIILYGNDFVKIKASELCPETKIGRNIVHTTFRQNYGLILKALNYGMRWVLVNDSEYENYFNGLSMLCKDVSLSEFLIGHAQSSKRIKFAALKCAIIDNLCDIVLTEGSPDALRVMMCDARKQYELFCDYNRHSFNFIKETPKTLTFRRLSEKVDDGSIMHEACISRRTFYRYKKDYKTGHITI
jgi:hypothetical protein